jgi:protein-tyrosine-phosphatase
LVLTDRKQDAIAFPYGGEWLGFPDTLFLEDASGRVEMDGNLHVTFVCVRNRVRSHFAAFYLEDLLRKRGEQATVGSAGFVPQALKDHLAEARIRLPEPLFCTSMSRLTREFLLEKGIKVPEDWRSRELSREMVDRTDLIFTALVPQKKELCNLYKEACHKFFAIRELSESTGYLLSENFSGPPLDQNYWNYAEEDPGYVSLVLREWEKELVNAFPNITRRLGMGKNGSETSRM